jgi:SEC-C motif domain protein
VSIWAPTNGKYNSLFNRRKHISECLCGSRKLYAACCAPVHANIRNAKSPEQVVCARFAAMASGDMDFFRESIVSKHRHLLDAGDVLASVKHFVFHSIRITAVKRTGILRHCATVHSHITRSKHGAIVAHAECCQLRREAGAWRVENIEVNPTEPPKPKIGRNTPCTCGSGRKHKHCCG